MAWSWSISLLIRQVCVCLCVCMYGRVFEYTTFPVACKSLLLSFCHDYLTQIDLDSTLDSC